MTHFLLQEWPLSCPCCGEPITVLIDGTAGDQIQVEDCQVCCQPLLISITIAYDGEAQVQVSPEQG